ncbi:MAG: ribonuclease HI [Gammaproteobacteria bacterium]
MTDSEPVLAFTDGACRGNPGPGGWGVLLRYRNREKRLQGSETLTTNNRMELQAAIQALASLRRRSAVHLTTDSKYVKSGITDWVPQWKRRGWKTAGGQPVKNRDLWALLEELVARHDVTWFWVRGHSGHEGNEIADRLANDAIDALSDD